jgi:hypothetical protein
MRLFLLAALLLAAASASAQVYRWVDEGGRVTYSNSPPPNGVSARVVDPHAKAGPPAPDTADCYTLRCQGERLEQRLAQREELETRLARERAAATPPPSRGLEFRKYISIQRGMSEGELVTLAGAPDLLLPQARAVKTYTYLPTLSDPFTTTVTLIRGRVSEIERVRKF